MIRTMAWTRQTPAEVDALFAGLRQRDSFGHRLHLFFAAAACVLASFPTTWLEWAWWPVLVVCLVRLISHHRILGPLVWEWPVRLSIVFVAWGALSLLWTAGTHEAWLAEWGVARYALLLLALWPVMNERRLLILSLAAGVVIGNLSQLGQVIGNAAGIDWLVWPRLENRNSGWWDPVVGGSILCAALGLHLAGLLLGRTARDRGIGAVLAAITIAAIAATGTRGAWIGAAATIACALFIAAWRFALGKHGPNERGDRLNSNGGATAHRHPIARNVVVATLATVLCAAAIWLAAGGTIARRIEETRGELARAMEGDYSTFTGARLAMWGWAGRAFLAHPVQGVGMGGYKPWVERQAAVAVAASSSSSAEPRTARPAVHAHAHSMPLHAAAATGAVGAGLLAGLLVMCIRNGLQSSGTAAAARSSPHHWNAHASGYDAAPALALVGLVCAGLFDSIQVNQQTAYWMWLLVALCMLRRPAAAAWGTRRQLQSEFGGVGASPPEASR